MSGARRFDDVAVGDELPTRSRIVTRDDIAAYAEASGDLNPLHSDDAVARAAGFPGVIAHGMLTMGHLATTVAEWAGGAASVARLTAQFRTPVYPGEAIVAGGRVRALDAATCTATLDVWVSVERDDASDQPIRRGEAVVRLAS